MITDQYLPIETVFDRQLDMLSKQKEICMLNGPLRMIPWSSANAVRSGGWICDLWCCVNLWFFTKCAVFFFFYVYACILYWRWYMFSLASYFKWFSQTNIWNTFGILFFSQPKDAVRQRLNWILYTVSTVYESFALSFFWETSSAHHVGSSNSWC